MYAGYPLYFNRGTLVRAHLKDTCDIQYSSHLFAKRGARDSNDDLRSALSFRAAQPELSLPAIPVAPRGVFVNTGTEGSWWNTILHICDRNKMDRNPIGLTFLPAQFSGTAPHLASQAVQFDTNIQLR